MIVQVFVMVLCLLGTEAKSIQVSVAGRIRRRSLDAVVRDNFVELPANERISKRSLDPALEEDVLVELPSSERISKRSVDGLVASRDSFELPAFERISKRSIVSGEDGSIELPTFKRISKRSLEGLVASRSSFELPAFEKISKRSVEVEGRDELRTRRKQFYPLKRIRRYPKDSYTGGLVFDPWMGRL